MKKLLLFALPICLLSSFVARADEAVQPASESEATKAPEVVDPMVKEFQAILNGALSLDTSKAAVETIQNNIDDAFASAENTKLAQDIAAKYPQVLVNGVIPIQCYFVVKAAPAAEVAPAA